MRSILLRFPFLSNFLPNSSRPVRDQIPAGFTPTKTINAKGARFLEFIIKENLPMMLIPEAIPAAALEKILASKRVNVRVYAPDWSTDRATMDQLLDLESHVTIKTDAVMPFVNLNFGKEFFEVYSQLRSFNFFSAGYNNVDRSILDARGINATTAGAPLVEIMAETITSTILDAHYQLAENIRDRPNLWRRLFSKRQTEWVSLRNLYLPNENRAEILWGQLLRRKGRLDERKRYGKDDSRFIGCAVHPDQTVMHEQLATNEEAGIRTTLGLVGDKDTIKYLAQYAQAYEVHEVLYWPTDVENALTQTECAELGLRLADSLEDLIENSDDVLNSSVEVALPLKKNIIDASRLEARHSARAQLATSLAGKTVGIWGLGNIGKAVAWRMHVFGVHLTGLVRNVHDAKYKTYKMNPPMPMRLDPVHDKQAFLGTLDHLVLTANLVTKEQAANPADVTEGFLDRTALEAMKKDAVIYSFGRGAHIVPGEVTAHLSSDAGNKMRLYSDVIPSEPDPSNPIRRALVRLENHWVLGHTGSAVFGVRIAMVISAFFENFLKQFEGKSPARPLPLRLPPMRPSGRIQSMA